MKESRAAKASIMKIENKEVEKGMKSGE